MNQIAYALLGSSEPFVNMTVVEIQGNNVRHVVKNFSLHEDYQDKKLRARTSTTHKDYRNTRCANRKTIRRMWYTFNPNR